MPTAVLFGTEDGSSSRTDALAAAARLRTDRVAELPGARHLALLGEPERFAAAGPLLDALERR